MGLKGYQEIRKFGKMLMVTSLILVAAFGILLGLLQAIYPTNPPRFAGLLCLGFPIAIFLFVIGVIFAHDWEANDDEWTIRIARRRNREE
jgi:hypothetical protein